MLLCKSSVYSERQLDMCSKMTSALLLVCLQKQLQQDFMFKLLNSAKFFVAIFHFLQVFIPSILTYLEFDFAFMSFFMVSN